MSDYINATEYNDPAIQTIRNSVSSKDDAIPYLLLPVKIETRFMKVDKYIYSKDVFTDVLEGLYLVDEQIYFNPIVLPPHEVLGKIRKIQVRFDEITTHAANINRLSKSDIDNLNFKLNSVNKSLKKLSQSLSKVHWDDDAKMRELRVLKSQMENKAHQVNLEIKQLKSTGETDFTEAVNFLDTLEEMNDALHNIGRKDLSTSDRKEKRVAFSYVDNQLSKIEKAMKIAKKDMGINMKATTSQLRKLDDLKQQIAELSVGASRNLSTIKSNYKKSEFAQKISHVTNGIESLHSEIDMRVRPKVEMKRSLKTINAREVIWQANEVRFRLKQLNRHPFKTYDEVRDTRQKLYAKLHALRANVHKVVEGNDEELQAISRAWDDTDKELEKFTSRVKAFKGIGRQKAGLTRTITHINKEYRRDLAGLKSSSKSYFTSMNNIALEKSAVNYTSSINRLKELKKEIDSSVAQPESKKFKQAITNLVEFQGAFSTLSRDIHLLPQKAFNEMNKLSGEIETTIKKISQPADAPASKKTLNTIQEATGAADSIKTIVEAQYSDAIDRKDRFYDEERSPFVFARKTITRDELWVRFYPDDIAIHTHEEALTQDEIEAGKNYWYEIWAANEDYETKLAAWRAISASYGSQRAAWIVRSLEPPKTAVDSIQNKFRQFSKGTVQINKILGDINKQFKAATSINDRLETLGRNFSLLNSVDEVIRTIRSDHEKLLLNSHRLLIKIQSHIGVTIKMFQSLSEPEKAKLAGQAETINTYVLTFNRIVSRFQTIERLSSKEIIEQEASDEVFPTVDIKDGSWTVVPHSKVMPERFVVATQTKAGQFKHLVAGKPLPADKLTVGLDPDSFNAETFAYDEDGNLEVDENIKWLTDFKEAKKKGMAVSITLDEEDLANGFGKVFVLGVKDSTATEGKELLEQLIDNHHYIPEGASFLPVSTPTNNTEAGESGYRSFEENAELSFSIERNNEDALSTSSDPNFLTDGELLAEGLGIDTDVLNNLDYHSRTEVSEALNVNKALFPGTLGNYMEEGLDTLFTLDNINHTKAFFNNFVTARGFLPSLRVGTQPYGILPTTAFSRYNATTDDSYIPELNKEDFENPSVIKDELQARFDIRLKQLLNQLDNLWRQIRNEKVLYSGNTKPENPQEHFMNMLGLQANSSEYFYRYGLNVAARQAASGEGDFSINFNSDDPWSPTQVALTFRNLMFKGYYYNSDYFSDEQEEINNWIEHLNLKYSRISDQFSDARVFAMRHIQDQAQILGDIIDNRELANEIIEATNPNSGSAEEQLEARAELDYFIDWLVSNNAWDIHAQNKYSSVSDNTLTEGMPSKSLLFILLRHSMLSAYADSILKVLEYEGLTDQKTRKKMGQPDHFYNRFASGYNYVTKWSYLFSKIDRLNYVLGFNMNTSNGFYTYMNSRSSNDQYLNRYLSPEQPHVYNNYPNKNQHQAIIEELEETRTAIEKLKDIPTSRLEQLTIEHIDLCTYRLDSWKLGMVNKRLKEQRNRNASGIYLGAYGWVEDLNKGGDREPAENIPSGLWKNGDGPVYTDEDNLGFIHTPSLNHAITAAMLRAGFDANSDTAEVDNQMAVNLSSGRVRLALNLLNGIRNGQDAAALLGYQFERGLHERYLHLSLELDEYIYDFREEFPLNVPVDESVTLGEFTLNSVVNGIELLEAAQDFIDTKGGPPNPGDSLYQSLKAFESDWWISVGNSNISAATSAKRDAMLREIDRMANAFDALGDLCISESVYQVARGNHVRASAIMDKLARGDVPNDIEIADTPRTGTVVTHKAGLFFEAIEGIDHELTASGTNSTPIEGLALDSAVTASLARSTGWNSEFTPRAIAEPALNKWIGQMIGDPSKIKCMVVYTVDETEITHTLSLADLEIQPLDALHLFGTGPLDGGAELNARIAYTLKSSIVLPVDFEGVVDDIEVNIRYTQRGNDWLADDFSFYEKAGYIQSLRSLLTNSAVLAADTLLIPGEEEVAENEVRNQDVDEIAIRITNLCARLQLLQDDWTSFFSDEISMDDSEDHTFTNEQLDLMRGLLIRSSSFGIPGTVPDSLELNGNEVGLGLLGASDGASKAIAERLKQAANDIAVTKDTTKSNESRINSAQSAGKLLLGKAFVLLPHFKLRKSTEINEQLSLNTDKGILRSASAFAMNEWSAGLSKVRERMAEMEAVEMWAENFDVSVPDKYPIQFPFAMNEDGDSADHWLGLEYPDGYKPEEDKLSVVLMNTAQISNDMNGPKAALLIDEWVEIIPGIDETTGITFNYDQPDAKAPNNLLLAVTPKETGHWSWDNLIYTLNDTLEMAKNRAVEPEHLEDTVFGQILPGIMTEIVPPQLLPEDAEDSGDAQDNPLGLQVVTDFRVVNDTYEPETED